MCDSRTYILLSALNNLGTTTTTIIITIILYVLVFFLCVCAYVQHQCLDPTEGLSSTEWIYSQF